MKAFGILHALVGRACDAVVAPLADANPWAALCAFSLLLALLSVLAFRVCGNQAARDRRRDRVVAHVLELRLYKDDLLSIFPIAGRVLAALPAYLASFALPVLVLLVPAVLLLTHAACWFEHRPLRPGEAALVAARSGAEHAAASVTGRGSEGLRIDGDPVRIPSRAEAVWRVRAEAAGAHWFEAAAGGAAERKAVAAGPGLVKVQPERHAGGARAAFAHPVEPPLPAAGALRSLAVEYPRRTFRIGGHETTWLPACIVLTLLLGWPLGRLFGVRF